MKSRCFDFDINATVNVLLEKPVFEEVVIYVDYVGKLDQGR